jgi:isoquinoline 1-oxidoreductase subunit beta
VQPPRISEVSAGPALSRREVIKVAGGLGLVLAFDICHRSPAQNSQETAVVNAWFRVAPSGDVTIYVNSTDLGQGSQSGMAQVMADELGLAWERVSVAQAPIESTFFVDNYYYTGGSDAIAANWDNIRRVAAQARAMLVAAAAKRWHVDPAHCEVTDGVVRHPVSGKSATYGELAPLAAEIAPPENPALKRREQWTLIGKSMPRTDVPQKVNGSAKYAIDIRLPGMLNAAVAQCPIYGGQLLEWNESVAMATPGVVGVIRLPAWTTSFYPNMPVQDAVAVVAQHYWQAAKGLAALAPKWNPPSDGGLSKRIFETLREDAAGEGKAAEGVEALTVVREGDLEAAQRKLVEAAFSSPRTVIDATYEVPPVAHATMEPMTAVADWQGRQLEIWTGTQAQLTLKKVAAEQFRVPESSVIVNTTLAGGGFGRRYYPDSAIQAAQIAQAVQAPIKVIWSRSEDIQHDLFRPPAVARFKAAISDTNEVAAVQLQQARICRFDADNRYSRGMRYAWPAFIAQFTIRSVRPVPMPWGAWRAVEDTPQFFFLESFVDELAHAVGVDPLQYRKRLMATDPRAIRLLNAVERLSGWNQPLPPGRGRGVAFSSRRWVAEVAEVSVVENAVRVERVVCAFDPGTAVNPDSVVAQGEGSILFGLSAALFGEITFKDGRVEQSNFDTFRVVQMKHCPAIEIHILETPEAQVGGVGEPMTGMIAPAVTNAIFAACGRRIRKLPIVASGLRVAE